MASLDISPFLFPIWISSRIVNVLDISMIKHTDYELYIQDKLGYLITKGLEPHNQQSQSKQM